jgi:hypothetical protein
MLEQHEARVEVARDIRERIDSTLDERLRLSVVGGGANLTQAGGAR